jgi:hypothetical protein
VIQQSGHNDSCWGMLEAESSVMVGADPDKQAVM